MLNLGGGGGCSNGVSHSDLWLRRPQGGAAGEHELGPPGSGAGGQLGQLVSARGLPMTIMGTWCKPEKAGSDQLPFTKGTFICWCFAALTLQSKFTAIG